MNRDSQSLAQRIDAISDDLQTPVGQLREMVAHFVAERDWHQFHAPKNISMALAIEAAELMEHFQWITVEASRAELEPEKRAAIGEEIADVMCYALALCNEMGFDVATLMREKMKKNVAKYPADEFRGRYGKEDPPKTS
ncbi:nucleotide pyrophosphohydrolase [Bremerella cremea]|uniref:Nucleotide pyrophosphohydrolase n=1 Tax=Bremerella cremea TaxID=1031537 RepID=A0A368KZC1_9BACT|nr:nucleotide pyrophosphohydrolase [Bremerella cremea]RCS56006.1 nucleotide pyrophosphohydrolase [Bremerella cremea]